MLLTLPGLGLATYSNVVPWPTSRVADRAFAGCDDLLDESKSQEFSLVHKRKEADT